jgi:hypothetical protein
MRLGISLEGTLCQRINDDPRIWGVDSERFEKISDTSHYRRMVVNSQKMGKETKFDYPYKVNPKDLTEGFEHENSFVVFRPNIDILRRFRGASSPIIVSLSSSNLIRSISRLIPAQEITISEIVSIDEGQRMSSIEPVCLIDDSLDSIQSKMPHLPTGSVYLLVDTFEFSEQGFRFVSTFNDKGEKISNTFKNCLEEFERLRGNALASF